MILPEARQQQLLVRIVGDETVIYDLVGDKVHSLNPTAAAVWRCCNGRTTLAEAATAVAAELGQPPSEEVVRLALEQLGRRNLLLASIPAPSDEQRTRRREVLKYLAISLAAALPVIVSLAAPSSAQAISRSS